MYIVDIILGSMLIEMRMILEVTKNKNVEDNAIKLYIEGTIRKKKDVLSITGHFLNDKRQVFYIHVFIGHSDF